MKHIFSLALCVVMLFAVSTMCFSTSAALADTVTFTVNANDAKAGEMVNVTVDLSENSGFANATIYLHYDPAVVEYVSDEAGEASPNGVMYLSNNFVDEGYVKLAYVSISPIMDGGELLVFEFKALSDAPATFTLSFKECVGADENNKDFDINYEVIPCTINNNGETLPTTITTESEVSTTTTVDETTTTAADVTTTVVDDVTTTTEKDAAGTTTATDKVTTTKKVTTTSNTDGKVPDEDTPKTGESSFAETMIVVAVAAVAAVALALVSKKVRN